MRILLIGGCGFIGHNLTLRLLEDKNITVRVLCRHETPYINELIKQSKIEVFFGDYANVEDLLPAINGCDVVYHLATSTIPNSSFNNPVYDIEANLVPSVKLLKICVDNNIKKLIYASSGGTIYGNHEKHIISESDDTNPITPYGIGKLSFEKFLGMYHSIYGLDYIILRISNPYGPFHRIGAQQGAVNVFIQKALSLEPLEVYGDGEIIRDYIYIRDVTDAMHKSLYYHGECKIFNLGTGVGTSINEVIKYVESAISDKVTVIRTPSRKLDVHANVLDIKLIKDELDWQPQTTMSAGIKETVEWATGSTNT